MDDIDYNRKLKKRNDENRFDEIHHARSLFLKHFQITSLEYDVQQQHMKKVQVKFSISWNLMEQNPFEHDLVA